LQSSASHPHQRRALEEWIPGFRRDAANAEFQENQKGQIKEGCLADMVLFSHDLSYFTNSTRVLSPLERIQKDSSGAVL